MPEIKTYSRPIHYEYIMNTANGVDLTGLLGGHKGRLGVWGTEVPQRVRGGAPVGGLGVRLPEAEAFCETTHNICIKIQQTTVAVTLADILNNITSKILGRHYHGCSPLHKYWGTCPPCPIGIDAPGCDRPCQVHVCRV